MKSNSIARYLQLIRGGREPSLQSLLIVTDALAPSMRCTSASDTDRGNNWRAAYLYLRRPENLPQSINDEQTQTLPGDELNRARLAWG